MNKFLLAVILLSCSVFAKAQTETPQTATDTRLEPAAAAKTDTKTAPAADKKMIDSATINLRTTVTGSQEQPRVLYIMPWQSPETPELGIQTLSTQADAVFGHIEREELVRKLEASGELDSTTDTQ